MRSNNMNIQLEVGKKYVCSNPAVKFVYIDTQANLGILGTCFEGQIQMKDGTLVGPYSYFPQGKLLTAVSNPITTDFDLTAEYIEPSELMGYFDVWSAEDREMRDIWFAPSEGRALPEYWVKYED